MQPEEILQAAGLAVRAYRFNTMVVGSGAAGLNAAARLQQAMPGQVALLTENLGWGTSCNTGSDKQTYYRLAASGGEAESVEQMACTLFAGGSMDGDLALAEAAGSARCFYNLVEQGVQFPFNEMGEYVGYKTDHDPCQRGSSAGPLTSQDMARCLLAQVRRLGTPIFEGFQAVQLLTLPKEGGGRQVAGVLALDLAAKGPGDAYAVFFARNVVYATGGEAGLYHASVYPASQTGGTGVALEAGALAKNLTEWQYGLASTKFRWNLSGSYQQVIPRYLSTNAQGGDAREFLQPYFGTPQQMLEAIFLKGYQWPFDPRKVPGGGSSVVDLAVYCETVLQGRRVFLDYTQNPAASLGGGRFCPEALGPEGEEYLRNCGAVGPTPAARLEQMNPAALALYRAHGIDLASQWLEVAVCAQHNNGGLAGDAWWQSPNLEGLFPVGEANGSHGVYRPGGSALNSGQVGSLRASQYIAARRAGAPPQVAQLWPQVEAQVQQCVQLGQQWMAAPRTGPAWQQDRQALGSRMSRHAGILRTAQGLEQALAECRAQLRQAQQERGAADVRQLARRYQNRSLLISQAAYLEAMADYIRQGGESRGSYLVCRPGCTPPYARLPRQFGFALEQGEFAGLVQELEYRPGGSAIRWRPVRPIPQPQRWFETVWRACRTGQVYGG